MFSRTGVYLSCAKEWTSILLFLCNSVDPFSKKDWYDVKAPAMFNIRNLGKTLVTRTQGTSMSNSCIFCILSIVGNLVQLDAFDWSLKSTATSEMLLCNWLCVAFFMLVDYMRPVSSDFSVSAQESPQMVWKDVCLRWASLTCRTMRLLSANSSSSQRTFRGRTASLTSTAWTWPVTRCAPWSRSGR